MDGLEFLKRCQSHLSETGTVVLTGYRSLDETVKALEVDARGFLTKPISSQTLLTAVRSALERQQSSSEYHRRDAYQPLLKLAQLSRKAANPNDVFDLFFSQAVARTGVTQAALFLMRDNTVALYKSEGFLSPPNPPPLQPIYNSLKGGDNEILLT